MGIHTNAAETEEERRARRCEEIVRAHVPGAFEITVGRSFDRFAEVEIRVGVDPATFDSTFAASPRERDRISNNLSVALREILPMQVSSKAVIYRADEQRVAASMLTEEDDPTVVKLSEVIASGTIDVHVAKARFSRPIFPSTAEGEDV